MDAASPARLLIVDDDEGLLFLMTEVLQREGHVVNSCETGTLALQWVLKNPVDLMLLDLRLDDLPAPILVEKLREHGKEIPFVVITGHGDEKTAAEIMRQGALDYVMKDAGVLELLPSVVRRGLGAVERERRLREANEVIQERELQNRKIIEAALDGFARFDLKGRILEVNDAFCDLLNYRREDLEPTEFLPPGLDPLWNELSKRVAESDADETVRFAIRLYRREGPLMDFNVSMRCQGEQIFTFLNDTSLQRRLEREVLEASEEERRRIGRDLHDGLGQQLTALEFLVQRMTKQIRARMPDLVGDSEEISRHIRQAITLVRQLSHGLAPVSLEAGGLVDALRDLVRLSQASGIRCEFDSSGAVSISDPSVATHLYRIAQEAIHNALKHSSATALRVALKEKRERIELSVEDNGKGIDRGREEVAGIGMQVMRYRAALIGAQFEIESQPGRGVRVVCSISREL